MNKNKKIPEIKIERSEPTTLGVGIMKISQLKDLEPKNNHDPYKSHRLKFNLILIVQEGLKGTHSIDFKSYTYEKRSIFFIAKDQIHHFIDLPKNNDGVLIVFNETTFFELSVGLSMLTNHFHSHEIFEPQIQLSQKEVTQIEELIGKLEEEVKKDYSTIQKAVTQTYLKLILLKIMEKRTHMLKEHNFNQQSLSVSIDFQNLVRKHLVTEKNTSFYADLLNMSSQKLNAITQETLQLTAKQYIIKTLILEAKRFLKGTDLSVKEISYQLGFDEPTNFNKFFKRYTEMSPLEFSNSSI